MDMNRFNYHSIEFSGVVVENTVSLPRSRVEINSEQFQQRVCSTNCCHFRKKFLMNTACRHISSEYFI
jgi:hypothetical protein